jgi:transcriptional regulator with XRE-family HTH domain
MATRAKTQNLIGPALRHLRQTQGLNQAMLAARCVRRGWWSCTENTISKIETGVRCITDRELVMLSEALRAKLRDLLPDIPELF